MVVKPKDARDIFPSFIENNFEAQAKRAGIEIRSEIKVDGSYICVSCKKVGKVDFKCELCQKRKSTVLIQESFGVPAEHLCVECYENVPAKKWEEEVERLEGRYVYDFY